MSNILKRIKDFRIKLAALGACIKCGYGFAGKAPKGPYKSTGPCPECGHTADAASGMTGRDLLNQKAPKSFGEKLYIDFDGKSDIGFVGPFYSHNDAEEVRDELQDLLKESNKWAEVNPPALNPDIITEPQMYDSKDTRNKSLVEKARASEMSPEVIEVWSKQPPTITSPSDAREACQTEVELFKKWYYNKQQPKDPNVAKVLNKIKLAQEAISKSLRK